MSWYDNKMVEITDVEDNTYYRYVPYTDKDIQVSLMSLDPGEDIPYETHNNLAQIIIVNDGQGILETKDYGKIYLEKDKVVIIPRLTTHYIKNISKDVPLKLISLYTKTQHEINELRIRQ